jgi:hypothetical protein
MKNGDFTGDVPSKETGNNPRTCRTNNTCQDKPSRRNKTRCNERNNIPCTNCIKACRNGNYAETDSTGANHEADTDAQSGSTGNH